MSLDAAFKMLDALASLEGKIGALDPDEETLDAFGTVLNAYAELVRENIQLSTINQGKQYGPASDSARA